MRRRSSRMRTPRCTRRRKRGARDYQFFKPAMNVRAVERQSIEESLRRALERQEIALHYQPKINLRTGAITGAEALIRWIHPDAGGVLRHSLFRLRKIAALFCRSATGFFVKRCKQARAWMDAGLPVATMAVNVSAMEFRDEAVSGRRVRNSRGYRPGPGISRAGADRERSHEACRSRRHPSSRLLSEEGNTGGDR